MEKEEKREIAEQTEKETGEAKEEKKEEEYLEPFLPMIFSGKMAKDRSLDASANMQKRTDDYLRFVYNGSDTTREYHESVLKQALLLTVVFTWVFCIVTAFICVMAGIIILSGKYDAKLLIPLLVSALTDVISGILIGVMQKLQKSRDDFFKEITRSEHFGKIIGLIQTIKTDKDKLPFIEKIIDGYCQTEYNTEKKK